MLCVSPEQMKKLCDDLRGEFDYILMDCPAGIEQGFHNAIAGADHLRIQVQIRHFLPKKAMANIHVCFACHCVIADKRLDVRRN